MGIVILSKEGCSQCDHISNLLDTRKIQYEKDIVSPGRLKELCGKNVRRYPQVLVDGKHLGDNFDLEEYLEEPLLEENTQKFTMFPIKYHGLWSMYKQAQGSFWTAEEIDFGSDMNDWNSLNSQEQHFIKTILAFFASSDGIVFENINNNFAQEIQISEAKAFYAYQEYNEQVHSETYSLLIDKYITNSDEKTDILNAINTIPCIARKAQWALKWFDKDLPFTHRLVAFICVEGIFFSGSFCAIFWIKKRGILPGLCFSNELISRDEGLHQDFAIELLKLFRHKPAESEVHSIIKEAVSIEKEFILDALPCRLIGMNSDMMSTYIEYVADRILKQLGYTTLWNSENPFDFMENISLDGKTNFFEKRVGDYGMVNVGQSELENTISFDRDDF